MAPRVIYELTVLAAVVGCILAAHVDNDLSHRAEFAKALKPNDDADDASGGGKSDETMAKAKKVVDDISQDAAETKPTVEGLDKEIIKLKKEVIRAKADEQESKQKLNPLEADDSGKDIDEALKDKFKKAKTDKTLDDKTAHLLDDLEMAAWPDLGDKPADKGAEKMEQNKGGGDVAKSDQQEKEMIPTKKEEAIPEINRNDPKSGLKRGIEKEIGRLKDELSGVGVDAKAVSQADIEALLEEASGKAGGDKPLDIAKGQSEEMREIIENEQMAQKQIDELTSAGNTPIVKEKKV